MSDTTVKRRPDGDWDCWCRGVVCPREPAVRLRVECEWDESADPGHFSDLRLEDLRKLLADRKISIELTPAAKEMVFTEGYDPNYGARPLKRAIQRLIQDPLALKILDGEVLHGDHVVVDADKKQHKLTFEVARRVGEPAAVK